MTKPSVLAWKEPAQARGRARVAAILDAAAGLAVEQGHLDFKMTTVAERAGVPIGSLYQFFPSRTALVARLFAREMEPIDQSLRTGLEGVQSVDGVLEGISALIKEHVALVKARPTLFVIWTSPTMEPALQDADFANSQANAARITERLLTLAGDPIDETAIRATALLVCHLWGHVVRLSILVDENGDPPDDVIDQYIAMMEAHFRALLVSRS
ncbi:MAG: TetR/AcrR family transcriptional regulator [Pseudomonadota bacterium]